MSMIQVGTYGAKRQSQKKASPRDLLRRVMDRRPNAPQSEIYSELAKKVFDFDLEDRPVIESIYEYWFANNYRSLCDEWVQSSPVAQEKKQSATIKNREMIAQAAAVIASRVVLLDTLMPNGKPLREQTAKDCAKVGGLIAKLGAMLKPGQKVGDAFSEAQVQKMYRAA